MRTKILILLSFFIVGIAKGQDNDDIKSVFNAGTELKGFGAFEMKLSPVAGENAVLVGGSGGVTVNKFLIFGIGGYGIASRVSVRSVSAGKDFRLYGGYGGMILGFNIFPRQVVHITFPILLGAGAVELEDPTFFSNGFDENFTVERSTYFVAEPQALIEVNVAPFFRFGIGGGYRFVEGISMINLDNEDMTNWTGTVTLKFGSF